MGFIADIFMADKAADATKDAARDSAKASQYATDQNIKFNREVFDKIWGGTQVQRDAGGAATRLMAQIMGLNISPAQQAPQPAPGSQYTPPSNGAIRAPNGSIFDGGEMPSFGGGMFGKAVNALAAQRTEPTMGTGQYGSATSVPMNALGPTAAPTTTPAGGGAQPFDVTSWLRSTPAYEANLREGLRAVNTGLASRGQLISGDAAREVTKFGQEHADRTFGDQFNRLAAIAGAGQAATSQGSAAGQSFAGNVGNALMTNAANLSSSYAKRGDATAGFWGDMAGTFGSDALAKYAGTAMKMGFGGF